MGEGPDGGPRPAEAGLGMGDSWVPRPGGLIRPWRSSALAWLESAALNQGSTL